MDRTDIMQSQSFEFLRDTWPELASLAGFAEHYAQADPQSAQTKLRNFAERCVGIVYSERGLPRPPMSKFMELAVVEAKKTAVDAEKGRHQAKHYADGLEKNAWSTPGDFLYQRTRHLDLG